MILRNVAIRHGRKALAAPIQKSFLRALTTETSPKDIAALEHTILNHNKETLPIDAQVNQLPATRTFVPPTKKSLSRREVRSRFHKRYQIKATTDKLGSEIDPYYQPHQLTIDPPKPEDVTLELLMASQSHLGHSTSLWNPMNQRYIFGVRQGIHIISLETTAAHLRRAAKVVEGVAYHGGLILFVGTRAGQGPCIVKAAELTQGCHLFEKWIPGSITNGDQILAKCGIKAVDMHDKEVEGYEEKIADWSALKPDLVVCLNPLENYILLHECGLNNIPTIGVVDTDADPTWVTYPIPANDDSLRCIQVIAGVLGRAGESGQKKRLEAAETGKVTWLPPKNLGNPVTEEDRKRAAELKRQKRQLGMAADGPEHTRGSRGKNGEIDYQSDDL
ncbi:ribosomal protein S2 [Acephala macrosclerotiorum]|nr:ribosomal protein S2 [Acephala macrosclerotiorum]